jgi:flagellar biosynthesis protein FliQ
MILETLAFINQALIVLFIVSLASIVGIWVLEIIVEFIGNIFSKK